MRNILKNYPQPEGFRKLKKNFRNFQDRITASYRDKEFYDGSKNTGYGGYKYDGRWKNIADNCFDLYELQDNSSVLQINCDFGFLLHDIFERNNSINIVGTETSDYAIENSLKTIKDKIKKIEPVLLDFEENSFDLVIALGVVYTLNLSDAIKLLKKINSISKNNNSFITLATYNTEEEKELFEMWTLGGNLCLKKDEWHMLFNETGYKGDYLFIDSNYLKLKKDL